MITIEQRAAGRDNNFNLLRMLAATAVLVSHAWPLALGENAIEPLLLTTGYKLGTTCVTIFFAISGFFITKSFDRRVSISDFAVARIARIYPGLLVVLVLTVALLGPAFTSLPLLEYLANIRTWAYIPINLSLALKQWALPGVFASNPAGAAVNGSLWTLYYEALCYLLVVVATLAGLTRRSLFPVLLLIAAGSTIVFRQSEGGGLLHAASTLTLPFALGSAAYIYRAFVPLSLWLALLLIVAAALCRATPAYPLLHAVALSYAALWFGFARIPLLRPYNRLGDYSYGMYIYAFPVEQAVVALFHGVSPLQLTAISLPITTIFAYFSWTWVEEWALAHRHTIAARLRLRRMH